MLKLEELKNLLDRIEQLFKTKNSKALYIASIFERKPCFEVKCIDDTKDNKTTFVKNLSLGNDLRINLEYNKLIIKIFRLLVDLNKDTRVKFINNKHDLLKMLHLIWPFIEKSNYEDVFNLLKTHFKYNEPLEEKKRIMYRDKAFTLLDLMTDKFDDQLINDEYHTKKKDEINLLIDDLEKLTTKEINWMLKNLDLSKVDLPFIEFFEKYNRLMANTNIRSYLAGLIEGDGTIYFKPPKGKVQDIKDLSIKEKDINFNDIKIMNDKSKWCIIKITGTVKDLPFFRYLISQIGGNMEDHLPKNSITIFFADKISVYLMLSLINGYFRTPKYYVLAEAINNNNIYVESLSRSNQKIATKLGKYLTNLEILPMDDSPIDSNAWFTGFVEADGNFSLGEYKSFAKHHTFQLGISLNYNNLKDKLSLDKYPYIKSLNLKPEDLSNLDILTKIKNTFDLGAITYKKALSKVTKDLVLESINVPSLANKYHKLILYFMEYPLLSSKYLNYKNWEFYYIQKLKLNKIVDDINNLKDLTLNETDPIKQMDNEILKIYDETPIIYDINAKDEYGEDIKIKSLNDLNKVMTVLRFNHNSTRTTFLWKHLNYNDSRFKNIFISQQASGQNETDPTNNDKS